MIKMCRCEGLGGKAGAVQKCPNCRGTGMQVGEGGSHGDSIVITW